MASSEAIWSGSTLLAKVGVVVNSRVRVKIFLCGVCLWHFFRKRCVATGQHIESGPTNIGCWNGFVMFPGR